ncbi:penicillin-binding protein 1A [Aureimonas psammosilenae]|uniref:penicillin-binding protein 1A n=1 Tax=Aureimonas psammosilenae TaxID=2495496 RepID=UPI001260757B|nr:penicillin-binding protein 1A [Aureimonas psammosilenae]
MIRLAGYLFAIASLLLLAFAGAAFWQFRLMARDLPDYKVLADYQPKVATRFYAGDGAMMAEYAMERRLYLPIQAIPQRLKDAFLSAEDKNFYNHSGVDLEGIGRAALLYLRGGPMQGGSTITQQVAKNFLLTNERSMERKVKEAILSLRIERAYSKDRILELYLNEIYLGMGSYGVAAASLAYFDKSVNELEIQEAAYLAALPKAPENYNPFRDPDEAIGRRNWVIQRMAENGLISQDEALAAIAKPLGVNPRPSGTYLASAEYFTEEVRRQVVARYGVKALYEGGLTVRTTLDPKLQMMARLSLQRGLVAFDEAKGWRGPWASVEVGADWGRTLGAIEPLADVPEWQLAVVLTSGPDGMSVGLRPSPSASGGIGAERRIVTVSRPDMAWAFRVVRDGRTRTVRSIEEVVSRGDVVFVERKADGGGYRLRQVPKVQGALVSMDPRTGRVFAMAGGFSYSQSEFNRATQAMRQPGSSFKPIVYAAALDSGYTPASVVLDAPISFPDGRGGVWEPSNYGEGTGRGPSTLRTGIEKSLNLMTVRLAADMGMPLVSEYAERFGVYDHLAPYLPMALGAGETTVMRMVSAYAVMANGGRSVAPSLIDRVQDRSGRTVWRHDARECVGCNVAAWDGQTEPDPIDRREQVLDPMTAYQITSMMEGVVQRGTATVVKELGVPVAGKSGTTNDAKDAWFVGYTPNLVTGLYVGYDAATSLGTNVSGGGLAAPIFLDFMRGALAERPVAQFAMPAGMTPTSIDPRTGRASNAGSAIVEAFKPGTGPADTYEVISGHTMPGAPSAAISPTARESIAGGAAAGLF